MPNIPTSSIYNGLPFHYKAYIILLTDIRLGVQESHKYSHFEYSYAEPLDTDNTYPSLSCALNIL